MGGVSRGAGAEVSSKAQSTCKTADATGGGQSFRQGRPHIAAGQRQTRADAQGLNSRHRTGRPTCFDPVSRCAAISTARGRPKDFGVTHRPVWTTDVLLETYRRLNPDLNPMSRTSLLRILNEANIRPHRIKMWLHSPDPLFREKVTEICELYTNPPEDAIVISVIPNPVQRGRARQRESCPVHHGWQRPLGPQLPASHGQVGASPLHGFPGGAF